MMEIEKELVKYAAGNKQVYTDKHYISIGDSCVKKKSVIVMVCSFFLILTIVGYMRLFCMREKRSAVLDDTVQGIEGNANLLVDGDEMKRNNADLGLESIGNLSQEANKDISHASSQIKSTHASKNRLVAELDGDLNAYRQSLPLFENFKKVLIDRILPIAIQGEKAGIWLRGKAKQDPSVYENGKYDKKKQQLLIMSIIAREYGDTYSQFQEAIERGDLKEPNEQDAIYFNGCLHFFQKQAIPVDGSIKENCPFEKGTVEYYLFMRDLGQMAVMATSPLGKMVYQIPVVLQKKQQKVGAEYKEPYLQILEDFSKKLGEVSKFHDQIEKIQQHNLDDSIKNIND